MIKYNKEEGIAEDEDETLNGLPDELPGIVIESEEQEQNPMLRKKQLVITSNQWLRNAMKTWSRKIIQPRHQN